ncbi:protein turtle homolog A isoform X1 [Nerophis ophidion]|uniref:protein turtle homolog A isoform X1 n=1 Tax=Nerophis ophidion TaxID=159077 RepID=UPI002ADF721A|nr:protein turtle homolog A isoform X1 [Nerophis ophidion]XP_061762752.1 protein turtle homolog A isoform X1 [Nerophis ophidion]
MGQKRRWLQAVTTALAICLLSVSQGWSLVVRGREGGSAELSCSLTPKLNDATSPNLFPLHVVEWVRLGYNVPILIKFGVYAPRVHPNYKGRVSLSRGASLLVERLTLEDEGWFECRILLVDSKTDDLQNGTWTFLSITAPPVFIKRPPTFVEVLLGDSLTLSCGAHGNPRPTVVWHKDESPIEKHEKIKVYNGSLSLASVTRNISGVYKCHVSNSEGNLTHTTQLQVKGPPIIIISPEDTTLNMSQDAVLQCQADAYPSNLTYEWMKQGQNVYHIESLKSRVKVLVDGTLLIPNLIPEDAGNYTCVPTNGILSPPSASAHLKVKHPARVGRMLKETYLPSGMEGVIVCPVQADPPVLYVNWTKDGNNLNLDKLPGWMVNSEGSVFIATANDNAVGMYTCTAYNSYGTMGQSEPTQVFLQDPPTFLMPPRPEYLQEVGRELIIPCEASADPAPNITWSKIGPTPRSQYYVLSNGSLLLQPLSKDHHGGWECLASNRVATVSAGTVVMVLGTSPHVVSSVSVNTDMHQANVSWVPGFDGGYTQRFTVWVKQSSRGKHEWASLPVPTSKNYLLVTGLLAGTSYQFSVLPQNKLGSGPFSEIVTVTTEALPTEAPTVITTLPILEPPVFLSANRTRRGVLLQWSPPEAPSSPLTGYVLQARRNQGQWVTLSSNISANQSEILVPGLLRDSSYELRLLSCSNKVFSEPSDFVNISTTGMEIYPLHPSFLERVPEPLLAGVIAGVCFLFMAIVLSLVTACYMSNWRERRRRKRRKDLPSAFQKSPSSEARSPPRSPDSVLKLKLCPPLPFFPTSSSQYGSSFDKGSRGEYQDQRKQLLANSSPPPHYALFESHLGSQAPSPTGLESISRGPDGRFIIQPLIEGSSPSNKNNLKDILLSNGGASSSGSNQTSFRGSPKSSILSSDKDERKKSPLTVDAPELSRPSSSPGRVLTIARNLSRHGCFYSDDEHGSENLLERASFYSDNSEKKPSDPLRRHRMPARTEDLFPVLTRKTYILDREEDSAQSSGYQPMTSHLTDDSTQVTQLDSELENDSIQKCIQLAKEREKMERELERYTNSHKNQDQGEDVQFTHSQSPHCSISQSDDEPVWKPQAVTLRQKPRPSSHTSRVADYRRACYFGSTSSPMDRLPMSHIPWDISPVTSVTNMVPVKRSWESAKIQHSHTCERTGDDSLADSRVTENTSLPLPSTDVTIEKICCLETPLRARSLSPQTDSDICTKPMAKCLRQNISDRGAPSRSRSSYAYGTQNWDPASRRPLVCSEGAESLAQPSTSYATTRGPSPLGFPTLPDEHHTKSKAKDREGCDDRQSLGLERENVRARSRRSDKCLFSDSPSPVSMLTLVEEAGRDQSKCSVPRMSGSFKTKPVASPQMSSLQTSAILEYLSLPGFIEMSVDEPLEPTEVADTAVQSLERKSGESKVAKPDVVPKNWEVHVQEKGESNKRKACFEPSLSRDKHGSRHYNKSESLLCVRFTDSIKSPSPAPEKTSKQLYNEKTQIRAETKGTDSRLGSRPTHTLLSAAKGMVDIVSKQSQSFGDSSESLSEQPQRQGSQGNRTNNIASRINQAPVPFLKKSFSVGPCRTLSSMGPPRPFLKKSISFGSQKWEHFESPRTYISERCYWDEFPNPDVRVKSYSLGHAPSSSFLRPGPSWREYVPFRRPSMSSLERSQCGQRSSPSYLTPVMYPPRERSLSPMSEPCNPRRQATVFPDSSRWSPSYPDTLRSAQYRYVPMPASVPPHHQMWPGHRPTEDMRQMDPRRGPPRSYLPRGISWPSPYCMPFPQREGDNYRPVDRPMGRGGETDPREVREGGRASYASQSSGRGSAGLFRQSLSITPTLLSSPETTEESERHRAELDLPGRRLKRRNTSVDESYEWDSGEACVDMEVLEALRLDRSKADFWTGGEGLVRDQPAGLQDQTQKGPSPSARPPVSNPTRSHSLSEARFHALRQEYKQYRQAQDSMCSRDNDSDSDGNSALL